MDKETLNAFNRLTGKFQSGEEFKKSVENMIDYINFCTEEVEKYKKKLEEYNKDEEIKKRDEKIAYLREHSLFEMTDDELAADKAFRAKHYKKCKNGNSYLYELTGNGIGICIGITCPVCKETKDITDVKGW